MNELVIYDTISCKRYLLLQEMNKRNHSVDSYFSLRVCYHLIDASDLFAYIRGVVYVLYFTRIRKNLQFNAGSKSKSRKVFY